MSEINTKDFIEVWKSNLKIEVNNLKTKPKIMIIVAKDYSPPSKIYIKNKLKACEEIGIEHSLIEIDWIDRSKEELKKVILLHCEKAKQSNSSIIIQSPFPLMNDTEIGEILNPYHQYDVDGFTPNQKSKLVNGDRDSLIPATALGVIELLKYVHDDLTGLSMCIVNRSDLIGKPLIQLGLLNDMSINIFHSKSKISDVENSMKNSDIVVTGCGTRRIFDSSNLSSITKTVIDCSMHKVDGIKGVGDFDKEDVIENRPMINIASGFGHTGSCTVMGLMNNIIKAHKIRERLEGEMND